ncbi:MAG: SDR family oxidoreductase [Deltaproteobacteria bacterium]|jgi:NAD(P)-dependent dehydrogenase (short-subunit alcohol dehydrogenase family)|nr:SDR family oxidoreductase [Deltaproteobacteria bacterium]MBW2500626.1 SDR family oxidoreductase [Deltaproteobacteria bacterium]
MGSLDGKVALITGAGQGVGEGIALALAAEGAAAAVAGRTLSKVEDTARQIEARGGRALPVGCDVKDPASLSQLVDTVVEAFGTIDILVNNAHEVPLGPLHGVSDEVFTAGWESGPLATFRLMKLCHPHLKGGGSIVNLASTSAKRWDLSNYGCYAATKEAIRSLTKAAACEWGPDGIRTNVILPHAKSPGLATWIETNPEEAAEFFSTIPMRRVGECEEDIGAFVALLCSEGSRYVNGQSIAIDGGQAFMG